jgi:hypothetical protein
VIDGPEGVLGADGDTVITGTGHGPAHVFTEPAGGWSGTVQPVAELSPSDGAQLTSVSMSGDTIMAIGLVHPLGPSAIYVFTEPAGGWSGTVRQTARIPIAASSLTLSGKTLAAIGAGRSLPGRGGGRQLPQFPLYVLHRPAGGWSNQPAPKPRAFIQSSLAPESLDTTLGAPLIAGSSIVVADTYGGIGDHGNCPCSSGIWAIDSSSPTILAPASLRTPLLPSTSVAGTLSSAAATDGQVIAIGAADGIHLSTPAPPKPIKLAHAKLTGLTSAKPRLSLRFAASPGAPAIASIRVAPPRGLYVSSQHAARRRGILASGGPLKVNSGRGFPNLGFQTIFLTPTRRTTTLTIGAGALQERPALRRALARVLNHGGHRTVVFTIRTEDTAGRSSQYQLTFTIKR